MIFAPFGFRQEQVTVGPTPTPSPTPTDTPTPTPTDTPTPTPTPTPIPGIITSGLTVNLDANDGTSYPGTGTTWFDISGNGYDSTLYNGPVFNSGTPDYFQFDGVNDYGDLPTGTFGSNTGDFTYGGWINPTTSGTEQICMIRGQDGLGGWSLMLNLRPDNKLRVSAVADGAEVQAAAPTVATTGVWVQVYGVWKSGSSHKLYINGALITNTSTTRTTLRTSSPGSWEYGRFRASLILPWKGQISTINLYHRELSDVEILENYNNTKSIYGY